MGNCARKIKRYTHSYFCKRRSSVSNKSRMSNCPKCNHYFGPYATYESINLHLDSCMSTQESRTPVNPITIQGETATIKVSKNHIKARPDEQFFWIKKDSKDSTSFWVKEKAQNRYSTAMLNRMSLKDASKLRFEDKRKWFRCVIEKFRIPWTLGADYLRVDRDDLFNTSIRNIKKCNLFKEVKVEFKNDEKVNDAGGLLREWVNLVLKELVKLEIGIFVRAESPEVTYTLNSALDNSEAVLDRYEFAGRVIGKAIFERITMNFHFDDCTLSYLAGKPVTLEDLQSLDTPLYSSLIFLRDNDINESEIFQEYFVVPSREEPLKELCPGGATKRVTDENKNEYIQLLVEWFGRRRIERKLNAFLNGIATVLPVDQLTVFNTKEIEMMISGVPFIDVEDWEANTIYKGAFYKTHKVIRWFWAELRGCNQQQLAKLLQFCTGSSRTPVEGFRVLESNRGALSKFCIDSSKYVKNQSFITAHTCFNRIVIPLYPSEDIFKQHFRMVLDADFQGVFGIE